MRTSSLQSLHELLVDLAHGMVNSCTRQKETHLFTKCSVLALTYQFNPTISVLHSLQYTRFKERYNNNVGGGDGE